MLKYVMQSLIFALSIRAYFYSANMTWQEKHELEVSCCAFSNHRNLSIKMMAKLTPRRMLCKIFDGCLNIDNVSGFAFSFLNCS